MCHHFNDVTCLYFCGKKTGNIRNPCFWPLNKKFPINCPLNQVWNLGVSQHMLPCLPYEGSRKTEQPLRWTKTPSHANTALALEAFSILLLDTPVLASANRVPHPEICVYSEGNQYVCNPIFGHQIRCYSAVQTFSFTGKDFTSMDHGGYLAMGPWGNEMGPS